LIHYIISPNSFVLISLCFLEHITTLENKVNSTENEVVKTKQAVSKKKNESSKKQSEIKTNEFGEII
jgi:hypothetical protein